MVDEDAADDAFAGSNGIRLTFKGRSSGDPYLKQASTGEEIEDELLEDEAATSEADTNQMYTPEMCKWWGIRHIVLVFFRGEAGHTELNEMQWATLLVVCFVSVLSGFDWELLPMAIQQIQTTLNLPEGELGYVNSIVKFGSIPSFFIALYADRAGRRRALLISATCFCMFTLMTGLMQTPYQYALTQFGARLFIDSKGTVCNSYIIETMPEDKRGWALGTFQACSALGAGLSYVMYGIVMTAFGNDSWRVLYLMAVFQLPFLWYMFKFLPESTRYLQVNVKDRHQQHSFTTIFRDYPQRMIASTVVAILNGFAFAPGDLLKVKYMQTVHGYTPAKVSLVVLFMGTVAFASFTVSGRLSDKYGRKKFLIVFQTAASFGVVMFYTVQSPLFIVFFFIQLQAGFVLVVVSNIYFGECFPTSVRATAQSALRIISVVSGILSIALESVLYSYTGDHWINVTFFTLFSIPAPLIIYRFLPETSGLDADQPIPEIILPHHLSHHEDENQIQLS